MQAVQTRLRDMQDSWLSSKADEIQSFADRKDMKFFDALKTVYGPQSLGTTSLLSADGTSLLTILKRTAEHFHIVLNRPSSINDGTINILPQVECILLLDEFPTVSETVKAIKPLARLRDQMQYLLRSTKQEELKLQRRWHSYSHYLEKRSHHSRIQGCVKYPPIQTERESSVVR